MSGRERKHRPLRHVRLVQLTRPAEPSVPEPQREEPPAESRDHKPDQKREDQGGAKIRSAWKVPDLKTDPQKLSPAKTGAECGDGHDVQGKSVPKSEEFKTPEGAEGKPQV
ncbi:X antigen family member 5-like [Saimiri boliviensis]|uniref:X antigen family member 5-like n=1 Tax=Saimiri boliviensis TaxID=27679 RepID=UPI003D7829A8